MLHTGILATSVALILLTGSLAIAADGANGQRVSPKPSAIATLARALESRPASEQWEFANIALDVLLEIYREELGQSRNDRVVTQQRRAKLARWQRATANLIRQIETGRQRLLSGDRFQLLVDRQDQVLIVAGGTPIALSGFDDGSDRRLQSRLIEDFCAFNACSVLAALEREDKLVDLPAGHWQLKQDAAPAYTIDGHISCQYLDISNRALKADLCRELALEVLTLEEGLARAARQGHDIDWKYLAATPPTPAPISLVKINREGSYLELALLQTRRLTQRDWDRLAGWMELRSEGIDDTAELTDTETLLETEN